MEDDLKYVPTQFVLYLLSPEKVTEQEQSRYTAQPRQWQNRYQGGIKALFWYFLSVLLSMAISHLH